MAAAFKELKQLGDLNAVGEQDPDVLTWAQKKQALLAVNLVKEKRCGKIKGRTCANGAPHKTSCHGRKPSRQHYRWKR